MSNKRKSGWIIAGFIAVLTIFEIFYDWQFGNGDGQIEYNHIFETLLFLKLSLIFAWISFVKKKLVLINFSIFLVLWGGIELGFALFLNQPKTKRIGEYSHGFVELDEDLGYKPQPITTASAIKVFIPTQDTIYNVNYSTDGFSRRKSPINTNVKNHALFFGGSFTFGEGLQDYETIPAFFATLDTTYQVYNYGFCGYGPQQMLSRFETSDVASEIKEKNGICVYSYIDDHVKRANGFMRFVNAYGEFHPHYIFNQEIVERNGNFRNNLPIWQKISYKILGLSNVLKYFRIDFPLYVSKKHLQLTAKIIEKGFDKYEEQFGSSSKFLVILPGESNQIVPYFQDDSIRVLDFSKLFSKIEYRLHSFDNHTTGAGNNLIARQLVNSIKKNN